MGYRSITLFISVTEYFYSGEEIPQAMHGVHRHKK